MEIKRSVTFTNRSNTILYECEMVEIPRVGEHVTIHNGKAMDSRNILEGTVLRVRWFILDSEHTATATVVLDEQPIEPLP